MIALILAIIFYYAAQKESVLSYYIHPVRATVAAPSASSKLKLIYDGREVEDNVFASQVALWNRGTKGVRGTMILKDVVIGTSSNTPILDTKIRYISRDVVGFDVDESEINNGTINVKWKIMEQNDGVIIQLIYQGKKDTELYVQGILEGQGKLINARNKWLSLKPKDSAFNRQKNLPYLIFLLGVAAILIGAFRPYINKVNNRIKERVDRGNNRIFSIVMNIFIFNKSWTLYFVGVTYIILGAVLWYFSLQMPPFDFLPN